MPKEMPKSLLVIGSGAIEHRIRQLLSDDGRGGHGVESAAVMPVEDAEVRLRKKQFEAGHEDPS